MYFLDLANNTLFLVLAGIGAAAFGLINLIIQAANGELSNFSYGFKAFGSGAISGIVITAGVTAGLGVPVLETLVEGAGIVYGGTLAAGMISGLGYGIFRRNWVILVNTLKLFGSNFYLDGNRSFLGQSLQGIGRFSWELLQSMIGHGYSQIRNAIGGMDRVDHFGGVTFSTGEKRHTWNGISIGNFININLRVRINGNFEEMLISAPLYRHEYGHTFQSQIWGPGYLLAIGLPSLISAATSRKIPGTLQTTHENRWYETQATRFAAKYFNRYFRLHRSPFKATISDIPS